MGIYVAGADAARGLPHSRKLRAPAASTAATGRTVPTRPTLPTLPDG